MISIGARVKHPTFGEGIVTGQDAHTWQIFFREGDQEISRSYDKMELLDYGYVSESEEEAGIDMDIIEESLRNVIEEMNGIQFPVEMAEKWEGGTLDMLPGKEGLQSKQVPIETFFHKIVMMRDRLRVLEQNINSHKNLSDQDKVSLQQYITRCYGSMTTFNVLFEDKEDYFSGEKK
ncbi:MAG: hypothetical protein HKN45_05545 [Flavobacteriales bacterium]|nr:hypothetical protein [Flavobacteriales bacterium]